MAIATATSLGIHVGGKLLFEDVSFKLEPRERMTLSGRNGAGKSTLLRMLAGELSPGAGSLVLQKGGRVALPDQRPPPAAPPQPRPAERGARRPPRPAAAARLGGDPRRVRLLRPCRDARSRG